MTKKYFTTPIYYVNADPHIGHAHTTIMADILKRSALMRGEEALLSTGTDEHGQKNQQTIEQSGLTAEQYLSRQSGRFRELFDRLNISYDIYVRTSAEAHKKVVAEFLSRMHAQKLIIQKSYTGIYCEGCEQFKRKSDLTPEGKCPDHPTLTLQESTETNYFLRMAPFQDWLVSELTNRPDWIKPESYRREVLNLLATPLEDLCISRPKSRVWLGVELPFDTNYTTYVWFDALINYVSNLGWPDDAAFPQWWAGSVHLMAKDIVKTHCIYWPIMLKAVGIDPPAAYRIHGYWLGAGGVKMSKTIGNVVVPSEVIDMFGVDGLRFYLARAMTSSDSQMSPELIATTYNQDLANNIGNLYSRVAKVVQKYLPDGVAKKPAVLDPADQELLNWTVQTARNVFPTVDLDTIPDLAAAVVEIGSRLNGYFEGLAPWSLAKNPDQRPRLESLLFTCVDCLRILFELAYPLIPATAERALANMGAPPIAKGAIIHTFEAGKVPEMRVGIDTNLFPRFQVKKA